MGMKRPKTEPTPLDETIVLVQRGNEWVCRYKNAVMGELPIGPRLAKGDSLPSLSTTSSTRMEGLELQLKWQYDHAEPGEPDDVG